MEEYDPITDTWNTKNSMPTPRNWLAVVVVNKKLYAIGGDWGTYRDVVEKYDPATDKWRNRYSLPYPVGGATAGVVNGRIYLIGGVYTDKVLEFIP